MSIPFNGKTYKSLRAIHEIYGATNYSTFRKRFKKTNNLLLSLISPPYTENLGEELMILYLSALQKYTAKDIAFLCNLKSHRKVETIIRKYKYLY